MEPLLDAKTCIVTGGAQGIGLATAEMMWKHGANIVVADVSEVRPDSTTQFSDRFLHVACDVTEITSMERLFDRAVDKFGAVNVLVNNAGITRDATLSKMTEQQFDEVINVNLKGVWVGTKTAASYMKGSGGGAIVNLSSISGKVGFFGQTNYSAAKAGVVGLTKAAAKEVARYGIRVNAVQPGLIETPMTASLSKEILQEKIHEIPLGRPGAADEVANAVLFFASELSSYVTGAVLEVTGGRFM
ncbi:3-oxoacyl-ACP reductase FabG [Actinomycetota bacterium]|nr:3-oxoacyl-ACP reductase FabG [Actinomycetota bacterium]